MTRNSEDSTILVTLAILVSIVTAFFGYAIYKGKKKELLISTPILVGVWWLEHALFSPADPVIYWIPFGVYVVYWVLLLFILPEHISYNTEIHWLDEDWWWSLDGWQFEEEVAKIYRKLGYKADVTKKTGDGGVDIIMYKDKKKIIVQCKHYGAEVGPEVPRALNGVKEDFRADELILIASSGVTRASSDFIRNKPYFSILDLQDVMNLVKKIS